MYESVTSCNQTALADGKLGVHIEEEIIDPDELPNVDYSFTWYVGEEADPASLITGENSSAISGLQSGYYTVAVVHCPSIFREIDIIRDLLLYFFLFILASSK